MERRRRNVLAVIGVALGMAVAPPAGAAATGPAASAARSTSASAQGTADPVVIVNGTLSPEFVTEPLAARLRADGYTVRIFVLTDLGTGDIRDTARDLATFVDGVRAETGAARVDLIGHSQGGLVERQFVKTEGGAAEVDSLVMLGSPNHGTTAASLAEMFGGGDCLGFVACQQMATDSPYVQELNAGDDTIGNVRYTSIYTAYDELATPYSTSRLDDGATNVLVQAQCPFRFVGHLGLILDGAVYDGIRDALRGGPIRLDCWAT
jgi:triacylglycerol esterase/lipase EstA (alpha/beta hydrolase family)